MGFESPRQKSIDEILKELDRGEIKSPRRIEDIIIETPSGVPIEARWNKTNKAILYTHNGITVEASYDESGITTFELTNPISGMSVADPLQKRLIARILKPCSNKSLQLCIDI